MPKGQSPSKRMDARRSRINAEVDEMSGANLPPTKKNFFSPVISFWLTYYMKSSVTRTKLIRCPCQHPTEKVDG